jgi:integrase
MPYGEAPGFMRELPAVEGVAARALEYAILTAARSGEVLGALWSEIDLENRLWTIPGSRMKAGKEHRIPLSDRAVEILAGLERRGEHVFTRLTGAKLKHYAMLQALKALRPTLTAHGFRSSFRDWCGDRSNFPREVIESALAHTVESKVEAAYRRFDALEKRRRLMEAWAAFLSKPADGAITDLTEARKRTG